MPLSDVIEQVKPFAEAAPLVGKALGLIAEIATLVATVTANKRRCAALNERIQALEAPLKRLESQQKTPTSLLQRLLAALEGAVKLVRLQKKRNLFKRIIFARSTKEKFDEISSLINECVGDLNLEVTISLTAPLCDSKQNDEDDQDLAEIAEQLLMDMSGLKDEVLQVTHKNTDLHQRMAELFAALETTIRTDPAHEVHCVAAEIASLRVVVAQAAEENREVLQIVKELRAQADQHVEQYKAFNKEYDGLNDSLAKAQCEQLRLEAVRPTVVKLATLMQNIQQCENDKMHWEQRLKERPQSDAFRTEVQHAVDGCNSLRQQREELLQANPDLCDKTVAWTDERLNDVRLRIIELNKRIRTLSRPQLALTRPTGVDVEEFKVALQILRDDFQKEIEKLGRAGQDVADSVEAILYRLKTAH